MVKPLGAIRRAIAGLIVRKPAALALAERKREYEAKLREQGHSKKEARRLTSTRFHRG